MPKVVSNKNYYIAQCELHKCLDDLIEFRAYMNPTKPLNLSNDPMGITKTKALVEDIYFRLKELNEVIFNTKD